MLLGIISAQNAVASAAAGALGSFDFVNHVYTWGATTYTSADITNQTGWITGNGMEVPANVSGANILLAAAKTFLNTCHWTLVFDIELTDVAGGAGHKSYFVVMESDTFGGDIFWLETDFWSEWELNSYDGLANQGPYDYVNGVGAGIHRVAYTRINNKAALTVDGNAILDDGSLVGEDTTTSTLPHVSAPMTKFTLGGYTGATSHAAVRIRAINFYDPVPDALLPSMSA